MRINNQYIEWGLQLVILVLLLFLVVQGDTAKCYCGVKPAKAPAGYTDRQSLYEMDAPVYPEVGVVPSQADAYQRLDNCYQNGGVYDFGKNTCRYDYQNMGLIRNKGYTNPQGKIVQEYAHQANRLPVNHTLPF